MVDYQFAFTFCRSFYEKTLWSLVELVAGISVLVLETGIFKHKVYTQHSILNYGSPLFV